MGNTCCRLRKDRSSEIHEDIDENQYRDIMEYSSSAAEGAQVAVTHVLRSTKPAGFEFDVNQTDDIRITGMAIINNDRLVICNNKSSHLLVYSTSGKYLHQEPVSGYPFDIAILSEGNQAVVSFQWENYVQLIDLSNPCIIAAHTINITYPSSGGISSYKNTIFIGGERGYSINSLEGKHLKSIKHIKSSVQNIYFLKYTTECVAYSDSKHVYLKNITNAKTKSTKEQATQPNGIAFDNLGNIYCTDYVMDRVFKFLKIDNVYKFTVILTKADGLYAPRALCFNDDYSKLCIANNDGQSIYVYNL
ncbi:unnamed protein product [Mytilus coruscus]|uniref:TRIM2_3 n=1 Tax=Mytilus coruscus TaxID=42192 RepID=A0A6J8DQC6_MYTCO|nr:unnamed protein product [Mytilus coruscus]